MLLKMAGYDLKLVKSGIEIAALEIEHMISCSHVSYPSQYTQRSRGQEA